MVDIAFDSTDTSVGVAFAKLIDLGDKENCSSLHKEQTFIFIPKELKSNKHNLGNKIASTENDITEVENKIEVHDAIIKIEQLQKKPKR
ncbi:unnamed protein product [Rotaria socialis]